jgi:hypothetical protein
MKHPAPKPPLAGAPPRRIAPVQRRGVLGGLLCILLSGCAGVLPQPAALVPEYRPDNAFAWSPALPATIKRVLILPLACNTSDADLLAGREALEPILRSELGKTKRFELLMADPALLRVRTGRSDCTAEESLPPDFLASLASLYGCDAVLFCRLTAFRAYPPLAIGWRMRLVDARSCNTLWATDEIFDAGQPGVVSGARHYQRAEHLDLPGMPGEWAILNSPRQFGQYAAASLLATLPQR